MHLFYGCLSLKCREFQFSTNSRTKFKRISISLMEPRFRVPNLLAILAAVFATTIGFCSATPSLLANNVAADLNSSASSMLFSTASTTNDFAKLCAVSAQLHSISCTAAVTTPPANKSLVLHNGTISLSAIASNQFLHARRISLNSFNISVLTAEELAQLFSATKLDNTDLSTATSECEELVLSNNNIRHIESSAFRQFAHLKTLDLSYNNLEEVKAGAFDKLLSLAILDLSSNQLRSFSPSSSPQANPSTLATLVMLNLRDNKLKRIPAGKWLCHMPALQHLSVARNRLDAVAVGNLTATTSCKHSSALGNSTTKSPPVAASHLTHLDLHGNLLYSLQNGTFQPKNSINLLFLDLSSTALSQVPHSLPESLRDLRLSQNNITRIRDDDLYACCPNLNLLVIEHSNLTAIADEALARLQKLERVWLSNNRLNAIPRLPFTLHGLFVDNNQIRHVNRIETGGKPEENGSQAELQHLHLRNNRISRFERCAFCSLPRLSILDLSENEISKLSPTIEAKNPQNFTASLFSASAQLELLNLSENFIGDSERLATGLSGLKSVAHVDFSFCTSLSQRRRTQQTPSETPEEEYKDTYDESNYISSNIKSVVVGGSASNSLFDQLISQQHVERIDLGYCAPLANDLFDFVRSLKKSNRTFASSTSVLISLNGFNFASTGADSAGEDRLDDLFSLLALLPGVNVDISDTEWNCSDAARVSVAVELLRQQQKSSSSDDATAQQLSSGQSRLGRRHRGALVQTSGTELTCLYPASLNGLSLHDERVVAHMGKLLEESAQREKITLRKKQLLSAGDVIKQHRAQLYANTVAATAVIVDTNRNNNNNKALTDDDDDQNVNGNSLKSSRDRTASQWWDISALAGDNSGNNNKIDSLNSTITESHELTLLNNMSCSSWQTLLAKQYYKLDSLLRHFQAVTHLRYSGDGSKDFAAYDQQQQQHHASTNRNEPHPPTEVDQQQQQQWWPMVKSTSNDSHAVRQAAIFAALFVALLMVMCLCAALLIYCCYYRCLIWSTSRRRRLGDGGGTSRYSKSTTDNNAQQHLNGRAVIQLTTTNERLSSATSLSSVPSTASSSATTTSAESSSSAETKRGAQQQNNNGDIVHYSRYRNQISTTPSTIFSIVDAANEHQLQRSFPRNQNNANTSSTGTLYDYPNSAAQQAHHGNVPYSTAAAMRSSATAGNVAHNNNKKLSRGISSNSERQFVRENVNVREEGGAAVRKGGGNANEQIYFAHPLLLENNTQSPQRAATTTNSRSRPSGLVYEQF